MEDLNKYDKLNIIAFQSEKRVEEGSPEGVASFEAVFNVESYSRQYENVYQGPQTIGINTSGRPARYSHSRASRLTFQLLIDNTGIHKSGVEALPAEQPPVSEQVQNFLEVCYQYDGEIHQPRFLAVNWGSLSFNCRLISVDIRYTLFDKGGDPLRAELDTVFIEDISDEERVKKEDKKSPDVGRVHIFVAGDSLPLLAKQIYGSAAYYLHLAKVNEIDHFREIEAGRSIFCPPLEELKAYEIE